MRRHYHLKQKLTGALVLAFCLSFASAVWAQQYQHRSEAAVGQNVALADFVAQRKQLFNFDWRFLLVTDFESTQEAPSTEPAAMDFDDSSWRTVDLPHDFQFELPWQEEAGGARGFKAMAQGWYRKTFVADSLWRGKRVLLDFGGIMYLGDVYVNGTKVYSSEYGYVGFEVDVTKHLRYGEKNVVAVWSSTGPIKGSRWYTGGGLFRDVYLKLQNPTHIARHGVFVRSDFPEFPNLRSAEVTVMAEVDGWKHHDARVRATILSPKGAVVGSTEGSFPQLTKQTCTEVVMPAVRVEEAELWSPDTPRLYTAQVVVEADGKVVDSTAVHFGIRHLAFDKSFGFKLNGKKLWVQGVANHHDMGAVGVAAFDKAIIREFQTLKAFGFNAIRCSHNPYSERFTQLADSLGLLIVDELTDKWSDGEYWGGRHPFMTLWPEYIPEWVKRDRNSPSVILWSLGNELQIRPDWSGYKTNDWGITTYRIFDQMVKRYDPTRKTTVAMFPARAGAIREEKEFKTYHVPPELAQVTEVSSFNYQWDCYPDYFKHAPHMILFQSEAVTNQLLAPHFGMDRNRCVGLAYWGAIEYWGESNKWPKKGWNFSYFRHTLQPMPQAWLIRSAFVPNEPLVRIGVMNGGESLNWNDVKVGQKTYSDHWNHKPLSRQQVVTFTNADEVELLVNGQSVGRQRNDTTDVFSRNIITWQDVPYGQGGTIEAVAYNAGKEVARHRLETAGNPVKLVIEPEQPALAHRCAQRSLPPVSADLRADGMDLLYLNVRAVDSKGRTVPVCTDKVRVTVEGAAQLVAVDNGDHFTDELFLSVSERRMMNGQVQLILRSRQQAGRVVVKVESDRLSARYSLNSHK